MQASTRRNLCDAIVLSLSVLVTCAVLIPEVFADGKTFPVTDEAYKTECGSCHVAYPPQLLPGSSWQAVMAGLEKHFGTEAGLDAQVSAHIASYLESNAGWNRARPGARTLLRIIETDWFRREHDEVSGSAWRNPIVKTPANCGACHTRADRGDYSERSVRVPQ